MTVGLMQDSFLWNWCCDIMLDVYFLLADLAASILVSDIIHK